jgi:hypothetical protein
MDSFKLGLLRLQRLLQSAAKRAQARVAHERQVGRVSTTNLELL